MARLLTRKSFGVERMYFGNVEPALEELLNDPVALLMMACDGLEADHVRACFKAAKLKVAAAEEERRPADSRRT